MHLRPLLPHEYDTVAAWAIAENWPGANKHVPMTLAEFPDILVRPGHVSLGLADAQDQIVGFGQIWTNSAGDVNLVRILVAPPLRGRGFGKQLCALLLDHARTAMGAQRVKLRVYRNNLSAIAVYRALGFEAIDSESNADVLAMQVS
jgi:ribosomal-protein-alanine N-acetyltransferase